jgi:hypothetical protein
MRIAMVMAVCVLAACASDKLASTPPTGVDLSGHWKFNDADSDDAQRLMQSQLAVATANANSGGQTGGGSGRQRGRGALPQGPLGPVMPPVTVLDEGLRWPGRDLSIKQSAGVVSFYADGNLRECRANAGKGQHGDSDRSRGRGDAPPPRCGWDEGTLVVQSGETDEDHPPYEQRFSLSTDGERLIEVVMFKGGRSNGFSASRVWDRAPAGQK